MIKQVLFATVLMASVCFGRDIMTSGAEVGKWTMDFKAAQKLSEEKNLPMFVNFTGSDWCGWCKLMDKQVFSQQAWQDYAKDALVLVWIDFPQDASLVPEEIKPQNEALKGSFQIQGYPTYVIVSAAGERLGTLGASRKITPEEFIVKVKDQLLTDDEVVKLLEKEESLTYAKLVAEKNELMAKADAWAKTANAQAKEIFEKMKAGGETEEAQNIAQEAISKLYAEKSAFEEKMNAFNEKMGPLKSKALQLKKDLEAKGAAVVKEVKAGAEAVKAAVVTDPAAAKQSAETSADAVKKEAKSAKSMLKGLK